MIDPMVFRNYAEQGDVVQIRTTDGESYNGKIGEVFSGTDARYVVVALGSPGTYKTVVISIDAIAALKA